MNCSAKQIEIRTQIRRKTGNKYILRLLDCYNLSTLILNRIFLQLPSPNEEGYIAPVAAFYKR